jgi:hypothetical protein
MHITQIYEQINSVDSAQNDSWKSSNPVCSKISILLTLNDTSVAEHYCYFTQVITLSDCLPVFVKCLTIVLCKSVCHLQGAFSK